VWKPEVTSYKLSEFSNQLNKIYIFYIVQNSSLLPLVISIALNYYDT
jgi:hypothetical protein